jgi:hypothetical protein
MEYKKRTIVLESDDDNDFLAEQPILEDSVQLQQKSKHRSNKKSTQEKFRSVPDLPGHDRWIEGDYYFEISPELIEAGGELRAMKARHCKLEVFSMINGMKGNIIAGIKVQLSGLPSEISHRLHCSKVDILTFNIDHMLPCYYETVTRQRLQELVLRTLLKMYHPSVRVASDGHLEYQGLVGVKAYLAMQRRFTKLTSTNRLHVVVFRSGAYYDGNRYVSARKG